MQDSLCGSMTMGFAEVPQPHHSSRSNSSLLDQFQSTMQQLAPPTVSGRGESEMQLHHYVEESLNHSSSSSRTAKNMVATIDQSPESPNLSCWFSDMIDELIEPASIQDSPMLFSPSHESISQSLTPSYSSFTDDINDKQDVMDGSPSLRQLSSARANTNHDHSFMESAQESNEVHQIRQDTFSRFSQVDINYKQQAQQRDYHHHQQQQQQQQHQYHHHQQQQHQHQQPKQDAQPNSSLGQAQWSMANVKASASTMRSNQPPSVLHKVVSAPQLCRLEKTRSPLSSPTPALSLVPPNSTTNYNGPHCTLPKKSSPAMSQSDIGRLMRKKSMIERSGNSSPHSHASSPPPLPNSLPSMGYLSNRINQPRSPMQPPTPNHHPNHQIQPKNTPMLVAGSAHASTIGTAGNGARELMAPLQQSSTLPMMPLSNLGQQDSGLRLIHLLLACAEAVAKEDYFRAKDTLMHLKQLVSIDGDSIQRVAAYFTDALHARLTGTGGRSYMNILKSYDPAMADEVLAAYQILYQACPYVKFAHFTANQAIFEAFEGEDRVHIVDLDIIQGYQWPAFIQALAARPGCAPHLRITGVGMPYESVQETGKRLTELAESLHVPFEFHAVGERLENLKAYMLQRRIGEALAVNSVNRLHRLLSEPMSPLFGVLHMIREQAPNIFTLVEQEASHNGPFFLGRFLEALHYYSAIFDSLDATLPQKSPERAKLEQVVFGNEITNIVACEGGERVERHEKLDKWRKIMEGIGYENVPLSANAVNQSKLLLGLYPCDGYTLVEDSGSLLLGWQERPIIAASAWRCI